MDTALSARVIAKRKTKNAFIILASLAILVMAIWLLRSVFKSSLKKSAIITAIVEKGNVENTINASGEIIPEFEEVISSPIVASIQKILLDAGSPVKAGQSVL